MSLAFRQTWERMLAGIVIAGTIFAATHATAAPAAPTTRILVELRDLHGDFVARRDMRRAIRDVRRMSDRAPLSYYRNGHITHASDLRRWRVIDARANAAQALLADLRANPAVAQANYERIYRPATVPNDPLFPRQHGLRGNAPYLADIRAPSAWQKTTGSADTVIAVVDGGVDLTHEDLRGKAWTNNDEVPDNNKDDDGNGYIDDVHGWDFVENQPADVAVDHGTHVAGIAAAEGNNGKGIAGVDWGARIMDVRVLTAHGLGLEERIIRGIEYAAANGADVINLSIVGARSDAIQDAIENAYAAGSVVVAAAGNAGFDTGAARPFPVCAEPDDVNMVLGVGALDDEGEPAGFSNYGACVDVLAPGDNIVSTEVGNEYGEKDGTSMSAPFASGAAGLYLAVHSDASPASVIAALADGAPFEAEDAEDVREWTNEFNSKLDAAKAIGISAPPRQSGAPTPTPTPEFDETDDMSDDDSEDVNASPSPSPSQTPTPQPESSNDSASSGSNGGGGGGHPSGEGDCCAHADDGSGQERDTAHEHTDQARVAGRQTSIHANLALVPRINEAFRSVFGRNPTVEEHAYWHGRVRRGEKRTFEALRGAMAWHNAHGRTYVPGTSSRPETSSPRRQAGTVAPAQSGASLIPRINAIHRQAYGRNPTVSEHTYWMGRVVRGEKKTKPALLGAMLYHRLMGIAH